MGSCRKTAAQKEILEVKTFKIHCGSRSQYGMKHTRYFVINFNVLKYGKSKWLRSLEFSAQRLQCIIHRKSSIEN
ncbi:hypothetical protein DEO72_LG11g3433 [Vigna unguiculata]|uniref:Uncharacterized protein n=1 Tax=Vigna unguiculata TaxID=3917 RepID=A0A4D6NSQ9_VIGUN|nr:hypothetical protein DEO72_LG11g3433 [Vigna unguiculata]